MKVLEKFLLEYYYDFDNVGKWKISQWNSISIEWFEFFIFFFLIKSYRAYKNKTGRWAKRFRLEVKYLSTFLTEKLNEQKKFSKIY